MGLLWASAQAVSPARAPGGHLCPWAAYTLLNTQVQAHRVSYRLPGLQFWVSPFPLPEAMVECRFFKFILVLTPQLPGK